ncbi:Holliday junction resolvase RuvX [Jannaschia sp. CCS1]|uniref:Putative pre-16S rRNA nuclease n=1 Tax=Jannaschia sp. (strain CCS1) TaxID=290400 RepID=YQGF_JANSC|nr:Holliday junction resolvase RuvX [Jannaschia sp. CCS1]Q28QB4.2 RecName: Full=Putative pre-16S rRNA nuclease [Jannaschia sp. CCS1]
MIFETLDEFAGAVPPMRGLIGLDLGTKTIGVALSDRLLTSASALETVKRKKFGVDADALAGLIAKHEVGGIILGLPRNMDGSEGPRAQATRAFALNLSRRGDFAHLALGFWDERLSTVAAERALIAADTSRKRRSEVIDAVAASYILQGALDRLRHLRAV